MHASLMQYAHIIIPKFKDKKSHLNLNTNDTGNKRVFSIITGLA